MPAEDATCSKRELRAACDRWTSEAGALLDDIRKAPAPRGFRKFLLARIEKILARLRRRQPFRFWPYLFASIFEKMLENLTKGTARGKARALYLCACQVIDQATASDREPMKGLLPNAWRICDQARELMR